MSAESLKLVFIGDAHGKMFEFRHALRRAEGADHIFQLGDMGVGFPGVAAPNSPEAYRWIRGNHDAPEQCRAHPRYLGDYGYLPDLKLFYVAGAFSIDRACRIEGRSWWADEELSYPELDKALELYTEAKPEIVISHECPQSVGRRLLADLLGTYFTAKGECCDSRTAVALERMFEAHQPKHWIFGHYHVDKEIELNGTKFHCCAELSSYELEIPRAAEVTA